jgi:hypothetical protein
MFPAYGGKCLSRKAVHNWVANEEVETELRKWMRLLCCGFQRTGKAMGQVYQCWWRMCREIFFYKFRYHMFCVLHPFVSYLLTLSRRWFLWFGLFQILRMKWEFTNTLFYIPLFIIRIKCGRTSPWFLSTFKWTEWIDEWWEITGVRLRGTRNSSRELWW